MPTPENRSKLLPARGTKAALEASLADLLDGEMTYATDEMVYYMVQDGALQAVNAAASTTTAMVETTEAVARRAGREVVPPDLPPGYTDLRNQREVNWWQHRETENVANRTTKLEQHQIQQDERIFALENAEGPGEIDLEGYATTEQLQAVDDRLKDVEVDYTTTTELNAVNSRVTKNSKEITELQEGFDAALLAAQEGADNLQIELQSYAKKENTPTNDELAFVDSQYKLADEKILDASKKADAVLRGLIDDNTAAIEAIQIPDVPDVDLEGYATTEALAKEEESRRQGDGLLQAQIATLDERANDLEAVVAEAFVGEAAIPANPYPGQQWMNPDTLTVMVFWQGQWVPCAPPVTTQPGVDIPNLPPLP